MLSLWREVSFLTPNCVAAPPQDSKQGCTPHGGGRSCNAEQDPTSNGFSSKTLEAKCLLLASNTSSIVSNPLEISNTGSQVYPRCGVLCDGTLTPAFELSMSRGICDILLPPLLRKVEQPPICCLPVGESARRLLRPFPGRPSNCGQPKRGGNNERSASESSEPCRLGFDLGGFSWHLTLRDPMVEVIGSLTFDDSRKIAQYGAGVPSVFPFPSSRNGEDAIAAVTTKFGRQPVYLSDFVAMATLARPLLVTCPTLEVCVRDAISSSKRRRIRQCMQKNLMELSQKLLDEEDLRPIVSFPTAARSQHKFLPVMRAQIAGDTKIGLQQEPTDETVSNGSASTVPSGTVTPVLNSCATNDHLVPTLPYLLANLQEGPEPSDWLEGGAELSKFLDGSSAFEMSQLVGGVSLGTFGLGEEVSLRRRCVQACLASLSKSLLRVLPLTTGSPLDILHAVALGVDVVQCCDPLIEAKRGIAFAFEIRGKLDHLRDVKNDKSAEDSPASLAEAIQLIEDIKSFPTGKSGTMVNLPSVKVLDVKNKACLLDKRCLGCCIAQAPAVDAHEPTDNGPKIENQQRQHSLVKESSSFDGRSLSHLDRVPPAATFPDTCACCDSATQNPNSSTPKLSLVCESVSYVHHLVTTGEMLGTSLLAVHNLSVYGGFLRHIRSHIHSKSLAAYIRWFVQTQVNHNTE
eukprot:GHVT01040748.1.p1 GENE.GHVT01040748.1~~GHVT01040748.1.p1  ORF type:complete len:688 (-),score=24.02 GHVT01040748.1:239-2302(-)